MRGGEEEDKEELTTDGGGLTQERKDMSGEEKGKKGKERVL